MIDYRNGHYTTKKRNISFPARIFPSIIFYLQLFVIVFKASRRARKGTYNSEAWIQSSYNVLRKLEAIGLSIEIEGRENITSIEGSLIVIGNHMSMMETLVLPGIIQPVKSVTFVVKQSLLEYPVFKHVLLARNPVAVTRVNPREDLKTIMTEGVAKIKDGISIIVFPQTTRDHNFDPAQMSSIGIKLAKKSGATILPLALKTDAWGNGKKFKDFGKINVKKRTCFSFGEPLKVEGKGNAEHQVVNDFISAKLAEWQE